MTIANIISILIICAALTALISEGIKKTLEVVKVNYASNVVVLIVAMPVGWVATALYYVNYQIPFNALNSVYLALMGVANWIGAMVGYDKVIQTIKQIGKSNA